MANLVDDIHVLPALAPDADRYNTDPATDIFSMANYREIVFVLYAGVGTTGTAVVTVEGSDDVSASNVTAIAFRYKSMTTSDATGDWTAATSSGFTTAAGSDDIYQIHVRADELPADRPFVRLVLTEGVDAPQDAAVIAIAASPRYPQENPVTAIV
jgi:hypothetical protein